jgi:hypothetical protein
LVVNIFQVDLAPFLQRPDCLILSLPELWGGNGGEHVREGDKELIL